MFVKFMIFCLIFTENIIDFGKTNAESLKSVLESNGIIPEVVNTVPDSVLEVRYLNGIEVKLGNKLSPNSAKTEPSVQWPTETKGYYTLAMVDPDAPSRRSPTSGQWRHWLVVDIPGNNISKGRILTPYRGPTPPKGTGLHRYIFLAYKQNGLFDKKSNLPNSRSKFNIRQFAEDHNLGQLMAINFFAAQS